MVAAGMARDVAKTAKKAASKFEIDYVAKAGRSKDEVGYLN